MICNSYYSWQSKSFLVTHFAIFKKCTGIIFKDYLLIIDTVLSGSYLYAQTE